MQDALTTIYGGDKNVSRAKDESLRGKFDDMRMQEGENIAQYCSQIKHFVNEIRGAIGKIDYDIVLRNFLRKLLPIYAIRFFAIQELRCVPSSNLTLECVVGRFSTFELSNFDNFKSNNIESTLKEKISLKKPNEKKKEKVKYIFSDIDIDEEDVEQSEALFARRFYRGKEKLQRWRQVKKKNRCRQKGL